MGAEGMKGRRRVAKWLGWGEDLRGWTQRGEVRAMEMDVRQRREEKRVRGGGRGAKRGVGCKEEDLRVSGSLFMA